MAGGQLNEVAQRQLDKYIADQRKKIKKTVWITIVGFLLANVGLFLGAFRYGVDQATTRASTLASAIILGDVTEMLVAIKGRIKEQRTTINEWSSEVFSDLGAKRAEFTKIKDDLGKLIGAAQQKEIDLDAEWKGLRAKLVDYEEQLEKKRKTLETTNATIQKLVADATQLSAQAPGGDLKKLTAFAAFLKKGGAVGQIAGLRGNVEDLPAHFAKSKIMSEDVSQLQKSLRILEPQVSKLETRIDQLSLDKQLASYKQPASEVRFLRVDPSGGTTIRPPNGENISEWNIVVIPLAIGRKPGMSKMTADLTGYRPGGYAAGFVDRFNCYAQPDGKTQWRVFAKQTLSAGIGEDEYGLDVCCLMIRKQVTLGNQN